MNEELILDDPDPTKVVVTDIVGRPIIKAKVVDIDIKFNSMIILMIKASFAGAIAFAVTGAIWGALGLIFMMAMAALIAAGS
jgi:hypothetical protein